MRCACVSNPYVLPNGCGVALPAAAREGRCVWRAGVLGKQVSNKFFNSLKDAGANLLHWNRDNDREDKHKQTPATSSTAGSEFGLDSMAVDDHNPSIVDSMKAAVS